MTSQMVFFGFLFTFGTILAFMMAGETAIVTSALSAAIDSDDTTITVDTTTGFLSRGNVVIGNEIIPYTGTTATTFTGVTRGGQDSEAASHPTGQRVYSEASGFINQVVGFNVLQTLADDGFFIGGFKALVQLPRVLINVITKFAMWDFEYLDGHAAWVEIHIPVSAVDGADNLIRVVGVPAGGQLA